MKKTLGTQAFILGGIIAGLMAGATSASANNRVVITELTKLRDTLPSQDPQRKELNLRIADLLSNECLVSSKGSYESRQKDCTNAFTLYQQSLAVQTSPVLKSKIRFQMARIALERGKLEEAKPLFAQVLAESEIVELKREAALRLAEMEESNPSRLAQAEQYYQKALELCQAGDSCSFAHYRIGWIRKREGRLAQAISEMKLAIFDSKGQARQEALRDLIVFMGQDSNDAAESITYVEQLGSKLSQPALLQELAYSYLTSGNKKNGVDALALVNARNPSIQNGMKLIEEIYGLRDWDRFEQQLSNLETLAANPTELAEMRALDKTAQDNLEKIAKRLAIQLDGERATQAERAKEFKSFSSLTLALFPATSDRSKLMEGWIAAETEADKKLAQIRTWIADARFTLTRDEKFRLQELRSGIAQKAGKTDESIEAFQALLALNPTADQTRSYQYAIARANYEKKEYSKALPQFQALAASGLTLTGGPDTWAVQSQNLALDILNQEKNLDALAKQAKTWTENTQLKSNAKLSKELADMSDVASQAEFQQAVALGESTEAVTRFRGYCEAKRFLPKSCENAKTLAIRMNRHADLIAILKITGPADELASEYEVGGYFKEAAQMAEKNLATAPSFAAHLKTALLFELAGDWSARDRVLNRLPKWITTSKVKLTDAEWMAIAATIQDANLVSSAWLKIPGASAPFKTNLAEYLEARGQGSKDTVAVLKAEPTSTGPAWDRIVWNEIKPLEAKEAKIGFYGKGSERKFQARVAALKTLNTAVDKALPGSPAELRVKLLRLSQGALERLANEIQATPLPEGLDDEQKAQIQTSLSELAKPFAERAAATLTLMNEEIAKVKDPAAQQRVQALARTELQALVAEETATSQASAFTAPAADWTQVRAASAKLGQNPKDTSTLNELKNLVEAQKFPRLSKYFEGRLTQLKQESSK